MNTEAVRVYVGACNREHAQCAQEFVDALDGNTKVAQLGQRAVPLNDVDISCIAEAIRVLEEGCAVRVLNLEENSFGLQGVQALMEAIESNPGHIRELRLGKNNLKDQASIAIGHVLSRDGCGLKVLDLSENGITKLGVIPITAALQHPTSDIVELSFHNNKIEGDAAVFIGQAIRAAPKLKHLHLGYNSLRDSGAAQLAKNLPHTKCLSTLDLTANRIGHDGGCAIAEALSAPSAAASSSSSAAGTGGSTVQRLNLRHNLLDSDAIAAFAPVLQRNTTLIQLFLGFMNPTPEVAAQVLHAAKDNPTLLLLDIYGWKLSPAAALPLVQAVQRGNGALAAIVTDACQSIARDVDEGNIDRENRGQAPIYVGPDDRDAYLATKSLRRYSRAQSRRQSRRSSVREASRSHAGGAAASTTSSRGRRRRSHSRGGSRRRLEEDGDDAAAATPRDESRTRTSSRRRRSHSRRSEQASTATGDDDKEEQQQQHRHRRHHSSGDAPENNRTDRSNNVGEGDHNGGDDATGARSRRRRSASRRSHRRPEEGEGVEGATDKDAAADTHTYPTAFESAAQPRGRGWGARSPPSAPVSPRDDETDRLVESLQRNPHDADALVAVVRALQSQMRQQRARHREKIHQLEGRIAALEQRRECRCGGGGGGAPLSNGYSGGNSNAMGSGGRGAWGESPAAPFARSNSAIGTSSTAFNNNNNNNNSYNNNYFNNNNSNAGGFGGGGGAGAASYRSASRRSESPQERAVTPLAYPASEIRDVLPDLPRPNDASGNRRPEETSLQRSASVQNFPPRIEPSPAQDANPPRRKSISHVC